MEPTGQRIGLGRRVGGLWGSCGGGREVGRVDEAGEPASAHAGASPDLDMLHMAREVLELQKIVDRTLSVSPQGTLPVSPQGRSSSAPAVSAHSSFSSSSSSSNLPPSRAGEGPTSGRVRPSPTCSHPRGKPGTNLKVNHPYVPPPGSGLSMRVGCRNHPFAPGLPPGCLRLFGITSLVSPGAVPLQR